MITFSDPQDLTQNLGKYYPPGKATVKNIQVIDYKEDAWAYTNEQESYRDICIVLYLADEEDRRLYLSMLPSCRMQLLSYCDVL